MPIELQASNHWQVVLRTLCALDAILQSGMAQVWRAVGQVLLYIVVSWTCALGLRQCLLLQWLEPRGSTDKCGVRPRIYFPMTPCQVLKHCIV